MVFNTVNVCIVKSLKIQYQFSRCIFRERIKEMARKYHYEFEWETYAIGSTAALYKCFDSKEFTKEFDDEFSAVCYAIDWMQNRGIDSSNLIYCRVEEVFDSEMRTNVLLWIGE